MIKKEYIKPESFVVVIPANQLILMVSANDVISIQTSESKEVSVMTSLMRATNTKRL